MTKIPTPPPGTKAAGRRLWRSVLADYELDEHETVLLRQAVRVADLCDDLQEILDADGPMVTVKGEIRTHPAAVELRQQRIVLARLVVALRVPIGDQEQPAKTSPGQRLQRRSSRGFYGITGGAA